MKFNDFLVEHAKFPLPSTDERRTVSTADISEAEAGLIDRAWKAMHAVRDNNLFHKLCDALGNILGDTELAEDGRNYLLMNFLPRIQRDDHGYEDAAWDENPNESQVSICESSSSPLTIPAESQIVGERCLYLYIQVPVGIPWILLSHRDRINSRRIALHS
jgi:hypothetical protein